MGTGAPGARDCALITLLRHTPVIHTFWIPGEHVLNAPVEPPDNRLQLLGAEVLAQQPILGPTSSPLHTFRNDDMDNSALPP